MTQKFYLDEGRLKGTEVEGAESPITPVRKRAAGPDARLGSPGAPSAMEEQRLPDEFNAAHAQSFDNETLHRCVERQVERTPDHVAVVAPRGRDTIQVTYRELDRWARWMAAKLVESGVEPGMITAIAAEPSVETVIGILAAWKAGAAYLPIDPSYPAERIRGMLVDSGARVLLAGSVPPALPVPPPLKVMDIHAPGRGPLPKGVRIPDHPAPPSLAYVLYTSGTTGRPKGVMVEHGGVVNVLRAFVRTFEIREGTPVLAAAPFTFDPSVEQVFGPLVGGGTAHIVPVKLSARPREFRQYILRRRIEVIDLVPSLLRELLDPGGEKPACLRAVISGGEALEEDLKDSLLNAGYDLYNHYGPTEATIEALTARCSGGPVTLGRPIPNMACCILDPEGKPLTGDGPGELCLAGAGITRGYMNRPEQTADAFINLFDNRRNTAYRAYRTGDLARRLPNGDFVFLGRKDRQVKIRGVRVELEEVRHALSGHPAVGSAVAVLHRDGGGNAHIAAYYTPRTSQPSAPMPGLSETETREYLAARLPAPMVPSYLVLLDRLPLTPGGKIDRKALPPPAGKTPGRHRYQPPSDSVEETLVDIWRQVLKTGPIGVEDNFFHLGGHSLKAALLAAEIEKSFGVTLPMGALFETPTIRGLRRRLDAPGRQTVSRPEPSEQRDYYPLSPAQARIFFVCLMEPLGTGYNMPTALSLSGPLDVPRLEEAFRRLIGRHEVLRTSFHLLEGNPVQRVHCPAEIPFAIDVRHAEGTGGTGAEWDRGAELFRAFIRPFDLETPPLTRVQLWTPAPGRHFLLWDTHHIVSDGASAALLLDDLTRLYDGYTLPSPALQYKDYVAWLPGVADRLEKAGDYWLERFSDGVPVLELPLDNPRPPRRCSLGRRFSVTAAEPLARDLYALARRHRSTLFMVLLAAYNILLHRYSGRRDIVVGCGADNRPAGCGGVAGMFVNMLVMRNFPSGGKRIGQFLGEVRTHSLEAFEHRDFQFDTLVEKLRPRRDPSRNPMFDAAFVLQNLETAAMETQTLRLTHRDVPLETARFDLFLEAEERDGGIRFQWEYATRLFKHTTVERLARHYLTVLEELARAGEGALLKDIRLLSPQERRRLLVTFNDTRAPYPSDKPVHALVEEQASRAPHRVAWVDRDGTEATTFGQLEETASAVARHLAGGLGVTPGEVVGVLMKPAGPFLTAVLAVLKAGGAYLAMDPGLPEKRIAGMIDDSGLRVILSTDRGAALTHRLRQGCPGLRTVVSLEREGERLGDTAARPGAAAQCPGVEPGGSAYVIYTSGSTGRPKGVVVRHYSLVNFIYSMYASFGSNFGPADSGFRLTPIAFDVAVGEIFLPLAFGARLVNAAPGTLYNVPSLASQLMTCRITYTYIPPGLLRDVRRHLQPHAPRVPLNKLLVGVEPIKDHLLESYLELNPAMRVVNGYGPTETTICSTSCIYRSHPPEDKKVPIGVPLSNTRVAVTDRDGNLAPPGAPGELFIAGHGLAAGYINNPELTAEQFVWMPVPPAALAPCALRGLSEGQGAAPPGPPTGGEFQTAAGIKGIKGDGQEKDTSYTTDSGLDVGANVETFVFAQQEARRPPSHPPKQEHEIADQAEGPFYRTGDRVRWLEDGNLEFLGRIDHQVKVRGYRVETAEIEHLLLGREDVSTAVVVALKDPGGDHCLAAYYTPVKPGDTIGAPALRDHLAEGLPDYMIPSFFIPMETLPQTPSGKIDRKALPNPRESLEAQALPTAGAPADEKEAALRELWQEVLGLRNIRGEDNFFLLGGHSLRAVHLAAMVEKNFQVEFPLDVVFEKPTLREQARYLRQARGRVFSGIQAVEEREYYPVSPAQRRIFALHRLAPHEVHYNIPAAFRITGGFSLQRCREVVETLIRRHESLRTSFHVIAGQLVQRVHPTVEFQLEHHDAGYEPKTFPRPFDLSAAPLLRVGIVEEAEDRRLLLYDTHHIAGDGVSAGLFFRQFSRLYGGEELAPSKVRYKDFSAWQETFLQSEPLRRQQTYWLEQFQGGAPVLHLPLDFQRPAMQSFTGASVLFSVEENITAGLRRLAAETGATLYMVLLALFNLLLHRYTGQEDIVVGTPVAGRRHPDLQAVAGMFVNTLAMRGATRPHRPVSELLAQVKTRCLRAFENQDFPFDRLVEQLQLRRDISRNPLFDVMLVFQNLESSGIEVRGVEFRPVTLENTTSVFDLTLQCWEEGDRLDAVFDYSAKLFKPGTIQRMASHLLNILAGAGGNPGLRASEIKMLSSREEEQLLYRFNAPHRGYPAEKTIHRLVEEQTARTPDRTAASGALGELANVQVTYRELDRRARGLAARLKELGVGPDVIVGLRAERSVEVLACILGILKAGGAYLPIDPQLPEGRTRYMLDDSGARIVAAPGPVPGDVAIEAPGPLPAGSRGEAGPGNLAYVIYTSGSTGRPKGVLVEHHGMVNLEKVFAETYHVGPKDRVLQFASMLFDASVSEFFMSLYAGACLVFIPNETARDHRRFEEFLEARGVTVVTLPPGYLAYLDPDRLRRLKVLITAGSPARFDQVHRWRERVTYLNGYGPTEATICASMWEAPPQGELDFPSVPIGTPLYNTTLHILDPQGNLQPIGIPGELHITGAGLARGYANRPELTAEKFVLPPAALRGPLRGERQGEPITDGFYKPPGPPTGVNVDRHVVTATTQNTSSPSSPSSPSLPSSPSSPSSPFYRTGDLARWLPDGNIEFLGRLDNQVKVRGYRVEPEEIEHLLLTHPGIREVSVRALKDPAGELYLAAYYVENSSGGDALKGPREFLESRLPAYMIPSYFVPMEQFPVNAAGKVDGAALPDPRAGLRKDNAYQPPVTPLEHLLVKTWQDVLGVKPVGVTDRFFLLGGDSIKAIQVASRLLEQGWRLDVSHLFQYPTIREVARHAEEVRKTIGQGPVSGRVELTPIQQWFFRMDFSQPHHWNQAFMLYRAEGFDEETVWPALEALVRHHDALRMVYRFDGNGTVQYNRAPGEGRGVTLEVLDLSHVEEHDRLARAVEKEAGRVQAGIDLTRGPLLKAALFRTAGGDHLLLAIHHLVVDGVSRRILLEDFAAAYQRASGGGPVGLPQKTASFRDWAAWLTAFARQKDAPWFLEEIAYWRDLETHAPPPLLGALHAGAGGADAGGDPDEDLTLAGCETVSFSLTQEETLQLLGPVHRPYRTQINDILLTALALALHRLSGVDRFVVNLEGHGRETPDMHESEPPDITRTVGWFTIQYPVPLPVTHPHDPGAQLRVIKETLRQIPHRGMGYMMMEELWARLFPGGEAPLDFSLRPEIAFNYLGRFDAETGKGDGKGSGSGPFSLSSLPTGPPMGPGSRRVFPLDIDGIVLDGRLTMEITAGRRYREVAAALADAYKTCLSELVDHCLSAPASPAHQYLALTPGDFLVDGVTIEGLDELKARFMREHGERAVIRDIYPLSPMQEGMLFHAMYHSGGAMYVDLMVLDLEGRLDPDLLALGLGALVRRHDALRTLFIHEGVKRPLQWVLERLDTPLRREDISGLTEAGQQRFVDDFIGKERQKGFELSGGPLLRVSLLRLGEERFKLIWCFHHIIIDGWCQEILFNDLFALYRSFKEKTPPPPGPVYLYRDYIRRLERQDKKKAAQCWARVLDGYEHAAPVPATWKPVKGENAGGAEEENLLQRYHWFTLDRSVTQRLEQWAARRQVTVSVMFQCVWGILLHRYNNIDDAVFGAVVSGRPPEIGGVEKMVGLFINTVPVRVKAGPGVTFAQLAEEVSSRALETQKYHWYALADIQAATPLKQDLIQHFMAFENYPLSDNLEEPGFMENLGFSITGMEVVDRTNYPFTAAVVPGPAYRVRFCYDAGRYEPSVVSYIQGHMEQVLHAVLDNPDVDVTAVEIPGAQEKERLLEEFNRTGADASPGIRIHQWFERRVLQAPDRLALVGPTVGRNCVEEHLRVGKNRLFITYRRLDRDAGRLAAVLAAKGAGPGRIVALMVEPGVEMITGIMGILKSGAAFLPIDPGYPGERIKYIMADSAALLLVTTRAGERALEVGVEILDMETPGETPPPAGDPVSGAMGNPAEDLVYVLYTSGTTGRPKGVMLRHRNLVNYVRWFSRRAELGPWDGSMLTSSYAFDLGYTSIFPALLNGCRLNVVSRVIYLDPAVFLDYIRDNGITYLKMTPSLFTTLVNHPGFAAGASGLRVLLLGGEAINADDVGRAFGICPGLNIMNHYGPTEATIGCIARFIDSSRLEEYRATPTIGRPIDNNRAYVLGIHGTLQPLGTAGELCVAGAGIARGYLNRPELTGANFVCLEGRGVFERGEGRKKQDGGAPPHLGADGPSSSPLYKTGDLVRWLPDGNLEFLGRLDHQVKIRGFRIETGEVEHAVTAHGAVDKAAVISRKDARGHDCLCGYYVSPQGLPEPELRAFIAKRLPEYMIPTFLLLLERLPMTPNGKLDRRALPEPGEVAATEKRIAPANEIERMLARIWQEVLGVDEVGVDDGFFQLGGHSLKVILLTSRIQRHMGVKVPLQVVFKNSTIRELCRYIRGAGKEAEVPAALIEPLEKREYYGVSNVQQRLYALNRLEGEGIGYNSPSAYAISGALDARRLEWAFQALVERHEAFRTSFRLVEGQLVQQVHDRVGLRMEHYGPEDGNVPGDITGEDIRRIIEGFIRPFDLSEAPLLRVGLIERDRENHILMMDMHHIIWDGISRGILEQEISGLYNGETPALPAIHYKEFAHWQKGRPKSETARQRQYWLDLFPGPVPVLTLPTDYPRPALKSYTGEHLPFEMDTETSRGLTGIAETSGATLYMVLLGLFAVLTAKYSGQEDIIAGSVSVGRRHPQLEGIIGMFVNTLPIRSRPAPSKTFRGFLEEVKTAALDAFENQDYQLDLLVEELGLQRDMSRHALFDVLFAFQDIEEEGITAEGLTVSPYPFDVNVSKLDLTLSCQWSGGRVNGLLEYDTALFKRSTIETMGNRFVELARQVAAEPDIVIRDITLSHGLSMARAAAAEEEDGDFDF